MDHKGNVQKMEWNNGKQVSSTLAHLAEISFMSQHPSPLSDGVVEMLTYPDGKACTGPVKNTLPRGNAESALFPTKWAVFVFGTFALAPEGEFK